MSWKILTSTGAEKRTDVTATSIPTRQIFTTGSGTYTLPAGCTAIMVECIGGGGGGGGVPATGAGQLSAGGSGGGGAYASKLIVNPSASYSYAVGSAGALGSSAASGIAGGDSSFGSGPLVLAKGGQPGTAQGPTGVFPAQVNGGIGGLAASCIGDETLSGESGEAGFLLSTTFPGAGGNGGTGACGGGGSAWSGVSAPGIGGGGCGSVNNQSAAARVGASAGGVGIIIVTEYYGVPNSIGTFPQQVTAPAHVASGLTGATATSRYAGATASGPPVAGNFGLGDFVVDQSGEIWICTVAGSPGTWIGADDGGRTNPVLKAEFGGSWLGGSGLGSFFCSMDSTPKSPATLGNQVLSTFQVGEDSTLTPVGYKLQYKIRVTYTTNTTSPAVTATWAPWEITGVSGGAGGYIETGAGAFSNPTTGGVVINSATFNEASSAWVDSTLSTGNRLYGFGVNLNANVAANSALRWRGQLWRRWIKA